MKVFCFNAVVFSKHSFGLSPKVLYAIDVVVIVSKLFGVVDTKMLKITHIQGL